MREKRGVRRVRVKEVLRRGDGGGGVGVVVVAAIVERRRDLEGVGHGWVVIWFVYRVARVVNLEPRKSGGV